MKSLSCVRLLATPWTAAQQAALSMGFSRQEYWSGLPLSSLMLALGVCVCVCVCVYIYIYLFIYLFIAFIALRYVPSIPKKWGFLSWKNAESFQMLFFCTSVKMTKLFYISFYYCNVLQVFWGILDHITSQRNIPLVMVYNLLNVFFNSVCWYFSDNLCIYIQSGYSPVVFFL